MIRWNWVVVGCIAVLLALPLWNLGITKWRHWQNPVPGAFYSIDGRKMHLHCSGADQPTIVIESGLGGDWLEWQVVQPRLSRLSRVCTYDRSGLGWSEPRSGPRDAETIARQLHALLDSAGEERPFVLAGHSAGGFYVREYARQFPTEVVGIVLIDSTSPEQIDELPGFRAAYEEDKRNRSRDVWRRRLEVWSGWDRLLGRCRSNPATELRHLTDQFDAQRCRPEYVGGNFGEFMDFETAAIQAARLTSFGNVPVLILSQDPESRREGMTRDGIAEMAVWAREQEGLKSLSPLSWRVIARDSGHAIHEDRPELIVSEMELLVGYLRGEQAPPFGRTLTK